MKIFLRQFLLLLAGVLLLSCQAPDTDDPMGLPAAGGHAVWAAPANGAGPAESRAVAPGRHVSVHHGGKVFGTPNLLPRFNALRLDLAGHASEPRLLPDDRLPRSLTLKKDPPIPRLFA